MVRGMRVSFMTRFRHRIATIPFVILCVVPVAVAAFIFLERRDHVTELPRHAESVCVDADTLAASVDACHGDVDERITGLDD